MDIREKFAVEAKTFDSLKATWLTQGSEGSWVAIKGQRAEGPFKTYREAWIAGTDKLGDPGSFMVKRVEKEDRPIVISHVRGPS